MDLLHKFDYKAINVYFDCYFSFHFSVPTLKLKVILFLRFAEWVITMMNLGFSRSKHILEAVKLYLDKANMKSGAFTDNWQEMLWISFSLLHY